jgi:hypothetical protein
MGEVPNDVITLPGLDPGIGAGDLDWKSVEPHQSEMAGTSPAMTS